MTWSFQGEHKFLLEHAFSPADHSYLARPFCKVEIPLLACNDLSRVEGQSNCLQGLSVFYLIVAVLLAAGQPLSHTQPLSLWSYLDLALSQTVLILDKPFQITLVCADPETTAPKTALELKEMDT